jgi:hypothetical protein
VVQPLSRQYHSHSPFNEQANIVSAPPVSSYQSAPPNVLRRVPTSLRNNIPSSISMPIIGTAMKMQSTMSSWGMGAMIFTDLLAMTLGISVDGIEGG